VKNKILKYALCTLACAVFTVTIILANDIFAQTDKKIIYKILCDAFCVPGVLCVLFAALFAIAGEGVFGGIGYGLKYAFFSLIPGLKSKIGKYSEYKEKHAEEKRNVWFMVIVGGAFFALSMVFLALYYSV